MKKIKKIGWLKYSGAVEIGNHLLFTAGNTNMRTNMFEEILNNNIELIVYSPLTKETKEFLSTEDGAIFNKIKVKMVSEINDDIDFLIVENGANNISFTLNCNGEKMPQIAYANRLIAQFTGNVFYVQTDLALPFIFFPEFFAFEYVNNYLASANFHSFFENKNFSILCGAKDTTNFHQYFNSYRYGYGELFERGAINIDFFEFHFASANDEYWKKYKIKRETEYSISYIGGERNRIKKFRKYYEELAKSTDVNIWGNWTEKTKQRIPDVLWHGILERGRVFEIYNNSFAHVIIADTVNESVKQITGRFWEVVIAKSLPLIDVDIVDSSISDVFEKELLDELVVSDKKHVLKKLKNWVGSQHRVDLIKECVKQMKQFTPQTCLQHLETLHKKYSKQGLNHNKADAANEVFAQFLEKRNETPEFSKQYNTNLLLEFYDKNTNENFELVDNKKLIYDTTFRCYECGDEIKNKTSNRQKCANCKKGRSKKDLMATINKNLKEVSKKIKVQK